MPNNAWEFYKASMFFATLDVFDGSTYYSEWFNFSEASALNSNFELMLIDTRNFLINSGSFYILFVSIIAIRIIKLVISIVTRWKARFWICRRIGMLINVEDTIWAGLFRLHLEMYLDILFAIFLTAHIFMEHEDGKPRFLQFLGSFDDMF